MGGKAGKRMDGADVKVFSACGRYWSATEPMIIAEIGTSHGADIAKAKALVRAAGESGADCAKFQIVYADEIIHPGTGTVPLPGGDIRLYDRFKDLEVPLSFFSELKAYTESLGLIFLCTPFGPRSARELIGMGVGMIKAASPELNHFPLLDELAAACLPLILSTGVSLLSDIEAALNRIGFPEKRKAGDLLLLHCVTAYPAPPEDYNLRAMAAIGSILGLPMGLSDHSADPVLVPLLSLAMRACAIEKHFTLSRSDGGLDDPIALDPEDFSLMSTELRKASALSPDAIVEKARERFGSKKVEAILGSGVKRLAPSEKANYGRTNRSLHALQAIRKGDLFSTDNVAILRTEKILRPGIGPEFLPHVLGRHAARDVPDGEGIEWEDVGGRTF
jgi:sialic acid synthase SpsE